MGMSLTRNLSTEAEDAEVKQEETVIIEITPEKEVNEIED